MNAMAKTGIALAIVAAVMVAASSTALRAQGVRPQAPVSEADRALAVENRPITAGVTAIESNGSVDLVVRQGATPAMTVHAERRLMDRIVTVQEGGTLRIEMRSGGNWRTRQPMRVEVTVPQLSRLVTRGSGDTEARGFNGGDLEVATHGSGNLRFQGQYRTVRARIDGSGDLSLEGGASELVDLSLSGSGDFTVSGRTRDLRAELHGSGDVDARQLAADSVSVRSNGSGDVNLQARQKVELSLNGSGDVHVAGQPTQRAVSRNGSGEVSWN